LPGSAAPDPPPPEPLAESFSVGANDPLVALGVHPADILIAGPDVAIPCYNLGLWCTDPNSGAVDDLTGLAYDYDFVAIDLPPVEFSVAPGSSGVTGTSVRLESDCSPGEPQADVFETALTGSNQQDIDGNGAACGANLGLGIGLEERADFDNLDALERDPYLFVDLNRDSVPEAPVYLTLAPGSPSLVAYGGTPADVLMTVGASDPVVWAPSAALGLVSGDVIDALCVNDNGNGVYEGAADRVLFSLAAGSPSLVTLGTSAASLLRPGPAVTYGPGQLGLESGDDVDALKCAADDRDGDTYFDIADNCPAWANPGQGLPPWPIPANDDDCDATTTPGETFMGTLPLRHCPLTGRADGIDNDGDTLIDELKEGTNDEAPDAWPSDADDDQDADIGDVIFLFSGKVLNPPSYAQRSDFDNNGSINIGDVIIGFSYRAHVFDVCTVP
jgi:hypothetical protein